MDFHPYANLFPLIEGPEFESWVADIAAHGVREPVWLYEGKILDGRNRYRAAQVAGVAFQTATYKGDKPLQFVVSLNLHRRHLSESQRAMVAAKLANMPAHRPAGNSANLQTSQGAAADLLNVSTRSVANAAKVLQEAPQEVAQAVEQGQLSVSLAVKVAELPAAELEQVALAPPQQMAEIARAVTKAHVANNSGNNEWYTPPLFIALAREVMGGIDCDPASSEIANQTVGARTFHTAETNGLKQQWHGRVWMNPPYAQPLVWEFCDAAASKFESGEIDQAIVLVNNGTETQWFQRLLSASSAVCFPRSRIKFMDPQGNPSGAPLQGQAIVYMGENVDAFAHTFGKEGAVLFNG